MARIRGIELLKAMRYSMVSVIGIVVTQALLLVGHVVVGLAPVAANTVAVMVAAVPVFLLNRAWVWNLRGSASFRRELAPFWGFTLAGLVLSTLAVAMVAEMTTSALAVSAANIAAFGALWVVKFFVLDEVIFAATITEDDLVRVRS